MYLISANTPVKKAGRERRREGGAIFCKIIELYISLHSPWHWLKPVLFTYHKSFHLIHRYSPWHRYRRDLSRYSCHLRRPGSSLGRWAPQCSRGAWPSSLWLWGHNFWLQPSSRRSVSQCRKPDQLDNEWLEGPLKRTKFVDDEVWLEFIVTLRNSWVVITIHWKYVDISRSVPILI